MERNKGITLVALIITIVVMLILVAVSVNVIIKSNLIGTAEKTVNKYKTASEEEGKGETVEIGGKKYASLDEYLKEKGMIDEEEHNWTRTGDDLECKHCNAKLTIGQEIDYTDNGKGSSSITAEKAGWTSSTISKDANTKWVVLGIENTDKDANGTNETLLITTKKPTAGTIHLWKPEGYNNCIEEINRMCKELYGEEARGMTIEDVNNCLQYTPAGGMYYDLEGNEQTTNNLITKLNELPTEIWNAIKDNNATPDGQELGEILLKGYWYRASENATFTDKEKEVIFGDLSGNSSYWLTSRGVLVEANKSSADFCPGAVDVGVVSSCWDGYYAGGIGGDFNYLHLRAVVPLRSDIPGVVE